MRSEEIKEQIEISPPISSTIFSDMVQAEARCYGIKVSFHSKNIIQELFKIVRRVKEALNAFRVYSILLKSVLYHSEVVFVDFQDLGLAAV